MTSLNPSNMSVGELISTLKDLGFLVGILTLGWKARTIIQPAIDFFKTASATMTRLNKHMFIVENGMNTLLNNHMSHIETDLAALVGRRIVNHERVEPAVVQVVEVPQLDQTESAEV